MPKRTTNPLFPRSKKETWTPILVGLYDPVLVLDADTKRTAARILSFTNRGRTRFYKDLDRAVLSYWSEWHESVRPKEAWHKSQIRPVLRAARALLTAASSLPPSTQALLKRQITKGTLRREDPVHDESLEAYLTRYIAACESLERKGAPGRTKKMAITNTVKTLMDIYSRFTGKIFPINLHSTKVKKPDRAVCDNLPDDDNMEVAFSSNPVQFVWTVMRGIDPTITHGEVTGAIRRAGSRQPSRVRKSIGNRQ